MSAKRCPLAVVGKATAKEQLVVTDSRFGTVPIDLPMSLLFDKPVKKTVVVQSGPIPLTSLSPRTSPWGRQLNCATSAVGRQ